MRPELIDVEPNEIEYPPEATVGDQWLREPWKPLKQILRTRRRLSTADLNKRISELAYQLFLRQGARHGHALDHWLAAEKMVYSQLTDREQHIGEPPDGKEAE